MIVSNNYNLYLLYLILYNIYGNALEPGLFKSIVVYMYCSRINRFRQSAVYQYSCIIVFIVLLYPYIYIYIYQYILNKRKTKTIAVFYKFYFPTSSSNRTIRSHELYDIWYKLVLKNLGLSFNIFTNTLVWQFPLNFDNNFG